MKPFFGIIWLPIIKLAICCQYMSIVLIKWQENLYPFHILYTGETCPFLVDQSNRQIAAEI